MSSINTNLAALQGAQALGAASNEVAETQKRIATGLKVADAKDSGAIWAIANRQRADSSSLVTVNQSLARASSALDVALSAGTRVSDTLMEMKGLALSALDPTISGASRTALLDEFEAHRSQLISIIDGAEFDGLNLLKSASSFDFLSSADGSQRTVIQGQDWNYRPFTPGPVIMLRGYSLDTLTYAQYSLDGVNQSLDKTSASLSRLGVYKKEVDNRIAFNVTLKDTIDQGVGNLVDADLGKEGARFEAQQVKQSLAEQALALASGASQWMVKLFRS
jgi:flagellin